MPDRNFPPPWSSEEHSAYYVVRDSNGQGLAYIYYENEVGRRSAARLLSKDEARRIAANFARLRSFCASNLASPPFAPKADVRDIVSIDINLGKGLNVLPS
jgi:hypothetical protein